MKNEALEQIRKEAKNVEGQISPREEEFLFNAALNARVAGEIVEIGSRTGRSTIFLAKGALLGGQNKKVYAVDPHYGTYMHKGFSDIGLDPDTFEIFLKNISDAKVENVVVPVKKTSREAIKGWDKPISFLFIDGDHRYEGVKSDYEIWWPRVSEGGVVAFHDSTYAGVKVFMKEFLLRGNISKVGLADSITYVVKSTGKPVSANARYVLAINHLYGIIRNIPFPSWIRRGVKYAGKKVVHSIAG